MRPATLIVFGFDYCLQVRLKCDPLYDVHLLDDNEGPLRRLNDEGPEIESGTIELNRRAVKIGPPFIDISSRFAKFS